MIKFKKYLILFFSIFTLIFIFNNNKINAYYNETKTIFSNSLKIDKNDYYDQNILNVIFPHDTFEINGITFTRKGETIIINGTATDNIDLRVDQYNRWHSNYWTLEAGKTLYGKIFQESDKIQFNVLQNATWVPVIRTFTEGQYTATTNMDNLFTYIYVYSGQTFNNYEIKMVLSYTPITQYSEPFKLGFYISNDYTNSTFSYTLIDNYDNSKIYTLNNDSSIYVPFQYIENNAVTFSYSVKWNTATDIYSAGVSIKFTPVFSGTLKGNNNNQLKSKYFYTYNYIYYQNFKLSNLIDVYLSDLLNVEFISSNYDNNTLIINNDNLTKANNVISDYTSDVKQQTTFERDIYFNGYNSIYTFNLKTNLLRGQNDQLIYSINFDYIGVGVLNSMSTNSYIDNTGNDLEVYNTCGNIIEDFGCNVSNAVTFVIFNIPIIGPVFNFAKSLVVGVQSLVDLINSFNGFGIMFGVFIIFMSYCIIRKIYNK